jgi:two-component sensor histidine kinase
LHKYFIAAFLTLLFAAHLFGAPVSIGSNTKKINIYEHSEVFIDKGAKHTLLIVQKSPSLFKPTSTKFGSFGYPSKDAIWVKFILHNTSQSSINKLLVFSNPFTDIINLYIFKQGQFTEIRSGILQKKEFGNTLQFTFPIILQADETATYYLQIMPRTGSLVFDLTIDDDKHFYIDETSRQMLLFLFFGAMAALIIYNLLLFSVSRDSVYVYYSLYLFAMTLQHLSLSGIISYLLPFENKSIVELEASLSVHYVNFVAISCILFTRKFLSTNQYKKIDILLISYAFLTLLISLVSTKDNYLLDLGVHSGFILIVILEAVGVYAYIKQNRQALYYIVAWSIPLSGVLALISYRSNVFDIISTFPYFFETTIVIEGILFSVILANKLNEMKQEKLKLSNELIQQQQTEQIRLSNLINERTQALNEALKTQKILLHELHHRVKNNMQFITSLYALKLHNSGDPKIDEKLKDIESKIKSMGHVHEMLYQQEDIEYIEATSYYEKLLNEISKVFDLKNIHIKIDTDHIILNTYEAIYCGLILNELIINAVKYAFEADSGEIVITIRSQDDKKVLEVMDNGKGLKDEDFNRSFGLLMVKSLAVEQLKGSFKHIGSHFIICF